VAVPSQNGRKDFSVPKENAISLYGKTAVTSRASEKA
jgi:hypothetical protein